MSWVLTNNTTTQVIPFMYFFKTNTETSQTKISAAFTWFGKRWNDGGIQWAIFRCSKFLIFEYLSSLFIVNERHEEPVREVA